MIIKLLKYYLEISRFQKMPLERVRQVQLERFRKLFNYAKKHSVFYRQLYKDTGVYDLKINSFEDIQKIPVIDKYLFKKYKYDEILSKPISDKLNLHITSGSTGEPFRVYQNKYEDYSAHVRVYYLLRVLGYHPFRKIVMITRYKSNDVFQVEKDIRVLSFSQKYLGILHREIISIYEDPEIIIEKIEKSRPFILWATPSILEILCNEMDRKGVKFNIPFVILTSEVILPHQRKKFNNYISKNIVSIYGLMESPTISHSINNTGNYNVFSNSFLVEYLNVHHEGDLKFGNPVVTNLLNFTMPFIRYNTNDIGNILDQQDFPTKIMGFIDGRADDILTFHDGRKLAHHHAHEIFMDFEECEQFKFVQINDGQIVLQLKVNYRFDKNSVKAKALERWNRRFPGYELQVEFVERFEVNTETGKFKNIEKITTNA